MYRMLIPIKSRSIQDIRKALLQIISTYGTPTNTNVYHNEPSFKSVEIRGLLESLGTSMYFTPVNGSTVNGIVERFHSTITITDIGTFRKITNQNFFEIIRKKRDIHIHQ